jgi:hypothetical protein
MPDAEFTDDESAPRTCPGCGEDRVVSVETAKKVYDTRSWGGAASMMEYDEAELVCEYCKAICISGDWTRMQTVRSRAWELTQASSSKGPDEYKEILTAGPERLSN